MGVAFQKAVFHVPPSDANEALIKKLKEDGDLAICDPFIASVLAAFDPIQTKGLPKVFSNLVSSEKNSELICLVDPQTPSTSHLICLVDPQTEFVPLRIQKRRVYSKKEKKSKEEENKSSRSSINEEENGPAARLQLKQSRHKRNPGGTEVLVCELMRITPSERTARHRRGPSDRSSTCKRVGWRR